MRSCPQLLTRPKTRVLNPFHKRHSRRVTQGSTYDAPPGSPSSRGSLPSRSAVRERYELGVWIRPHFPGPAKSIVSCESRTLANQRLEAAVGPHFDQGAVPVSLCGLSASTVHGLSIDTIELYERNMIDEFALGLVHEELPVGS
jgi:hypothetical protein